MRVELSHILEPDDKISVVGGGKVGANGDMRKLEAASLTLGALESTVDRTAPVVEIVAYDGADSFVVYVTEPGILHNELLRSEWAKYIKVDGKGTKEISISGQPSDAFDDNERKGVHARMTVDLSTELGEGDVITVERQAILDKTGRPNGLTRKRIDPHKAQGKFEVSNVSIGDYKHTAQASAVFGGTGSTLTVTAKATGIAAGAAGNDWVIYGYDDRPGDDPTASTNAFNIDVAVDTANQVISYTISEVKPVRDIGREANLATWQVRW